MKRKKQVKNFLGYKLDKKQQKKIVVNFGNFFKNFSSEYDRINKNRDLYYSLKQLKHHIDDPNDPEISWEKPFIKLQYPIEIDWEKTKISPEEPYKVTVSYSTDEKKIKTPKDLGEIAKEIIHKTKEVELFRELTENIVFIKRGENTQVLLPSEVFTLLEKEFPKEDYKDAIKEFSTKEFYFPLNEVTELIREEIEKTGITKQVLKQHLGTVKENEDHIYLRFEGLTINLDEKKAYYPIVVGLYLHHTTGLLTFNQDQDKKTQNEIMNILFESIL